MAEVTYLINDRAMGSSNPLAQIRIVENAQAGTLTFTVSQLTAPGAYLGDLRGLFFDVADESLIGTLKASPTRLLTELRQGNDSVSDLGQGVNMQGLLGSDGGYDVGIEIGTAGSSGNDVRTFSFTLASSLGDLTLDDFANVDLGVCIASVGQDVNGDGIIDTSRLLQSRITETTGPLPGVTLVGSAAGDTLAGGAGDDTIRGLGGDDSIRGLGGHDQLSGDAGRDRLWGGDGADRLEGGAGRDALFGEAGNDYLLGGLDDDVLHGGAGRDRLWGGAGRDALFGEAGNDSLLGGIDDDVLHGGAGRDRLDGGAGHDSLTGGADSDIFVFRSGYGRDTVSDFQNGADRIDLSSMGLRLSNLVLRQSGSDVILWLNAADHLTVRSSVPVTLSQIDAGDFIF
jgi:Ca2+-binding RTX toxin-like protein